MNVILQDLSSENNKSAPASTKIKREMQHPEHQASDKLSYAGTLR